MDRRLLVDEQWKTGTKEDYRNAEVKSVNRCGSSFGMRKKAANNRIVTMDDHTLTSFSSSWSLRRFLHTLQSAFFLVLAEIAPPLKVSKSHKSRYHSAFHMAFQGLHLLNLLSLAFPPTLQAQGYDPSFPLWRVFAYSRYDAALAAVDNHETALILAYCLVFTPFAVLCVSVIVRIRKPKAKLALLQHVLRGSLQLLNEAFVVPTMMVIWTVFAEIVVGEDLSHVYLTHSSEGVLYHWTLALAAFVVLMGLLYVQRDMIFEICWLNQKSNQFARYSASAHTRAVLCTALLCMSTTLWAGSFFRTQSCIAIFVGAYVCGKFTYVQPFYHPVIAVIIPAKYFIFTVAVVERLFAEYLESENTAWTLLLCLLPADLLVYYQLSRWRMKRVDPNSPHWTIRDFQLVVIQMLTGGEEAHPHSQMLALFYKAKVRFPRKPQIPLLESLYFLFTRNNPDVSQLKASLSPVSFSLQFAFLRYRLLHHFGSTSSSEKHQYVFFNTVFETVLKYDEYFCYRFGEFLSEVASWQRVDLTRSCESFASALETLERQYVALLTEFPRDVTVLTMFAGFLKDVKKDEERAQELNKRVDIVQKNGKIGPFDQSVPMIICEATGDRKVILTNKAFDRLMATSGEKVLIDDLNVLLPPFIREIHEKKIVKLLSATDKTTFVHEDVFLPKTGITAVFVRLNIEFIAAAGKAFIVVQATPRERYQEYAAVHEGTLIACTEEFLRLFGVKNAPNGPVMLRDVLPEYDMDTGVATFRDKRPVETVKKDIVIGSLKFTLIEVFNYCIRTKSRKESVAPSFVSVTPRPDMSKFMETHDYEGTSTKGFTAVSSAKRSRDKHRLRKREMRRMSKFLLLIVCAEVVLLIVESFVMFACYFQVVDEMDAVDSVNELGLRRYLDVRIVADVRQLQLLQSDVELLESESTIRTRLQSSIDTYTSILSHIRDNSTSWLPGPSRDLLYEPVVPIWSLINSNAVMTKCSLLDAMAGFLLRAQSVLVSDIGEIRNEDFFYVYRNGLGETLQFLNKSTFMHIQEMQTDQLAKTDLLFFVSVFLMCCTSLCSFALLCVVVFRLERKCSECWQLIFTASTPQIQRLWEVVRSRLDAVHSAEPTLEIVPRKHKFQKTFTRRYHRFAAVLTVFTLATVGYFLYVYITASEYVEVTMVTKANYMNWAGMRRMLNSLLSRLMLEQFLAATHQYDYFQLVRTTQNHYDFAEMIQRTIEDIKFAEEVSLRGNDGVGIHRVGFSVKHSSVMFGEACEVVNVTDCPSTTIVKGGHLGLLDFLISVSEMAERTEQSTSSLRAVLALSRTGTGVSTAFATAAAVFNQDSSAALASFRVLLWTFPGVYLAATVLLLPVLILPIKASYTRSLLAVWRTSGFFIAD